jgi:hypothetical protein
MTFKMLVTTSSRCAAVAVTRDTANLQPKCAAVSYFELRAAKKTMSTINVSSSDQLLSLLDGAQPGHDGKITISGSKSTRNSGNSSQINAPGRLNADHGGVDSRQMRERRVIDSRLGGRA